jgi:acyl-CoA synthetase (AMP-forming)/AMP-acid ligase II
MSLAQLVVDVARRKPNAPAITSETVELTYGDFAQRMLRLAGAFRVTGCQPGDRVVLWMENCGEFFECLFGCWAAGLCAVPCNAKLHSREVAHVIGDCGAALMLTTRGLAVQAAEAATQAGDGNCRVVSTATSDYDALLAGEPSELHQAEPEELAWLFYTSGTTGRPKGAMLSHRVLLVMCHCYLADIDQLTPDDVKLHTAPLSHASGLYGLPFFLKGARHIILPGFDLDDIAETIARHRKVTMFAAPTMLTRLANSGVARAIEADRIKTIYYGGGPMYVADLKRALEIFGPRLYQLFGQGESPMTITGLDKAAHVGADGMPIEDRLASCGIPRTGVLVRVVDENDRDLSPGEVGEVVTKSDCVMLGYWNNPDATEKTLRGGWLHTGDIGSLDENGYLTLRDRSKDMIISGGSNIYPREIEEVLLRHPGLVEASVVGRPHADWGEEVIAFVVPKPDVTVSEQDLDRLCLDNIARFKRPKAYRFVGPLPKNNYGKVLKTELRRRLSEEQS